MKIDKDIVKRSFSRAAGTYDAHSPLQKEVASDLARCVEALAGTEEYGCQAFDRAGLKRMLAEVRLSAGARKILDIGCGTGNLTGALKNIFPETKVYGCDIALPMLMKMKEKHDERCLVASDCESLPFESSSFDMAVSSLTYQWAEDLSAAFREAERVLRPGGLFVFSTLGPSTLNELRASYKEAAGYSGPSLMEFKGMGEISEEIRGAGLELISLETLPVFKNYPDLRGLLRTLKNIGAAPPLKNHKGGLSAGSVLKEAGRFYGKKFPAPGNDGIIATYEVIFAAARRLRTAG